MIEAQDEWLQGPSPWEIFPEPKKRMQKPENNLEIIKSTPLSLKRKNPTWEVRYHLHSICYWQGWWGVLIPCFTGALVLQGSIRISGSRLFHSPLPEFKRQAFSLVQYSTFWNEMFQDIWRYSAILYILYSTISHSELCEKHIYALKVTSKIPSERPFEF